MSFLSPNTCLTKWLHVSFFPPNTCLTKWSWKDSWTMVEDTVMEPRSAIFKFMVIFCRTKPDWPNSHTGKEDRGFQGLEELGKYGAHLTWYFTDQQEPTQEVDTQSTIWLCTTQLIWPRAAQTQRLVNEITVLAETRYFPPFKVSMIFIVEKLSLIHSEVEGLLGNWNKIRNSRSYAWALDVSL